MNYLAYAIGLYAFAVALYIVQENRRPQATFAWMFLFLTLPAAGVVIYWLFGREQPKFGRTRRLLRQNLPEHVTKALVTAGREHDRAVAALCGAEGIHERLARLVHSSAQALVTTGNAVEVLQDAAEAYPRLLEDLRGARRFIHLQYYSWSSDRFGDELAAILAAKVAEGVPVRVLYDPVGCLARMSRRYLRGMRRAGIRMEPVSPLWRVHTLSYRNHRKIAVIDGRIGHTGGLNIGAEHIHPRPGFATWRDTNLRIQGAGARALQAVFAVDWANATDERLIEPMYYPPIQAARSPGVPVQLCLSGPDSEWRAVRQQYVAMISGARRRIRAQSPFFILDDTVSEALKAAALSGVEVQIMISARGPGQFVPYWAANTYMAEVAASGVELFLYEAGYLHAKTLSVDGEVCSIGSANWDIRSFSINYELNAILYDAAAARQIERAFEADLAGCRRFEGAGYERLPRLLRLRDSMARLASPLL